MAQLTPAEFVEKWERASLKERASVQSHFDDLCRMLGYPTPAEADPDGDFFTYEKAVTKITGGKGFADVWYKGHFAIEYKGPGKYNNLDEAYRQLLQYREDLLNPPLLVVCDIRHWEVHTNFPNTAKKVYRFTNQEIVLADNMRVLRDMFEDPDRLNPRLTPEEVTRDAADHFQRIAAEMRGRVPEERLAHFLTRLIFCLFAEDIGLLPTTTGGRGIFSEIVEETYADPERFVGYIRELFQKMTDGGEMHFRKIRFFDGSLFEDAAVEWLSPAALEGLRQACALNWSYIDPSIFGTLFERVLDPSKRAQLGAHYTSREDILLIVEPVLMAPLRRQWEDVKGRAEPVRAAYDAAATERERQARLAELAALRQEMLAALRGVRVLDPACGSGNFLYVALRQLLDLEKAVIHHDRWRDVLPREEPQVHPRQLYGIEINEIAHDLSSIVVWIGYLQWHEANGYRAALDRVPLLERYENIRLMDAILGVREDGTLYDPEWPEVDVIVSNPPFLGGNKIRQELGDQYVDTLFEFYEGRVPAFADLCCYWFERARAQIERRRTKRAGLLATNSIRGGANREVLKRVKETGDIFMAWADRAWILEGAAVRVSMVGFDDGQERDRVLDGEAVQEINPDLTSFVYISQANQLVENQNLCFMGPSPKAPFDIEADVANQMLAAPLNPNGRPNSDVVRPVVSAVDIVRRSRGMFTIYFGVDMSEEDAAQYVMPFEYVKTRVLPIRLKSRQTEREKQLYWLYARPRPEMTEALEGLSRFISTPAVAKHRIFEWFTPEHICNQGTLVFARDDDYFFGVLHSRLHEVWSLRTCTWLGKGNDPRYTPTTTFETFPFPWPPGQEDTSHPAYRAISEAARQLHEEREAWLNPPGVTGKALERRTLTTLYNALNVFRGVEAMRVPVEAADFAPRLDALHRALDEAVCDAYGWPRAVLDDEEDILRRLLALNLARAG